jgi:hypothetical protein
MHRHDTPTLEESPERVKALIAEVNQAGRPMLEALARKLDLHFAGQSNAQLRRSLLARLSIED